MINLNFVTSQILQTLPNTKSELVVPTNAVVELCNLDIVMGNYVHLADYIKNFPFIVPLTHNNDGNPLDDPYSIRGQPGIEQ